MDKKLLTEEVIDNLVSDMDQHNQNEKLQLIDWLMANQLTKDKNTIALIESWEVSQSSLKRRTYWYYQGRLRWMGQIPLNSEGLLSKIENKIEKELPEVQWAMNFTTGWIGVYEKKYRSRCVELGEKRGCTKERWYQKDVRLNIYLNSLRLKVTNEICNRCESRTIDKNNEPQKVLCKRG